MGYVSWNGPQIQSDIGYSYKLWATISVVVPSILLVVHNSHLAVTGDQTPFSDLFEHHAHLVHIHLGKILIHIKLKQIKNKIKLNHLLTLQCISLKLQIS